MDINTIHTSNLSLNKSFSAPDISISGPLFRRVVIEEQYFSPNHNIGHSISYRTAVLSANSLLSPLPVGASAFSTRQYSVDQLISKTADVSFNSPLKNFTLAATTASKTSTPIQREKIFPGMSQNMEDSPMDVDFVDLTDPSEKDTEEPLLSESRKPSILDFVDVTYQGSTPVLKRKPSIKMEKTEVPPEEENQPQTRKRRYFSLRNIVLCMIVALTIPIYDRLNYNREINLENFQNELAFSVVGQPDAINQLTDAMYSFKRHSGAPEHHLLAFIGTTGVGKTHCVNIIKKKFMPKQIVEIDIDTFDLTAYKDKDHLHLYKTVPYLVILDNLSYKHIPKLGEILNLVPKTSWVLAIAVFNVQETDDFKTFTVNDELFTKIPQELSRFDLELHTIKFESFDVDFHQTHADSFLQVYNELIKDLPNWRELLWQQDFKTFGFKGLFEKMNVLSK